jgi:hypothetical protein
MLLVELWVGERKVNLEKLFKALERFGGEPKSSRGTKGRGWHPPGDVIFMLKELILDCGALGNMDILGEMEEKIGGYSLSLEKLIILAEIAFAYARHGIGKYQQGVLEVVRSLKRMLRKLWLPPYHDELSPQQLDKVVKFTTIVNTLGKILAVTMNPDIVKPIVELCTNIPPDYDYFSIRNLLEAMIWQIKSTKQGIEYSRCMEYD